MKTEHQTVELYVRLSSRLEILQLIAPLAAFWPRNCGEPVEGIGPNSPSIRANLRLEKSMRFSVNLMNCVLISTPCTTRKISDPILTRLFSSKKNFLLRSFEMPLRPPGLSTVYSTVLHCFLFAYWAPSNFEDEKSSLANSLAFSEGIS